MNQIAICLIICGLVIAGYLWGKVPMGAVALLGVVLFRLTGCVSTNDIVSYFGNTNAIIVVCMFILSAGFTRTQFVQKMAAMINRAAKGSIRRVFFGFMMLSLLLSQFIGWGITEFAITAPLLGVSADQLGVKRSKVMYPLGLMCLVGMSWLPIGPGLAQISVFNGLIESIGITGYTVGLFDPLLIRLPGIVLLGVYCVFVGLRISPDEPSLPIQSLEKEGKVEEVLPPFQEVCGYTIFFGTCIALIIATVTGAFDGYIVSLAGATLMVFTGVLSGKQALHAFPLSFYAVFMGALTMGGAMSNTGAAAVLGNLIASFAGKVNNSFLVYAIFFVIPFIVTQFMMNGAVIYSFTPVVLAAASAMGINPVGAVILVWAACTTAYMTPMSCPCIPAVMAAGGYDFKDVFRQSIYPSLIVGLCAIIMATLRFPLF